MTYRTEVCDLLARHCDLTVSDVLEVGSDSTLEASTYLANLGARSVAASNIGREWAKAAPSDGVRILTQMDARRLGADTESFSAVIGIAVLEHIRSLPQALCEICRVVKPGGIICLHGGPLWSCAKGHHVWVDIGDMSYRFNEKDKDPIPPWSHLLFAEGPFKAMLQDQCRIPEDHANAITHWVFRNPAINRMTYRSIMNEVSQTNTNIEFIGEYTSRTPKSEELLSLRNTAKFEENERFAISDLRLILRK